MVKAIHKSPHKKQTTHKYSANCLLQYRCILFFICKWYYLITSFFEYIFPSEKQLTKYKPEG